MKMEPLRGTCEETFVKISDDVKDYQFFRSGGHIFIFGIFFFDILTDIHLVGRNGNQKKNNHLSSFFQTRYTLFSDIHSE